MGVCGPMGLSLVNNACIKSIVLWLTLRIKHFLIRVMEDTRVRNINLPISSLQDFHQGYSKRLLEALASVDMIRFEMAVLALNHARLDKKTVYVAGNGGSAAISEHLECDFQKGCYAKGSNTFRTKSLVSNSALLTALGNDIGFEHIFSHQLEMIKPDVGDILLLISSSGNSPNIIKACEYAKRNILMTIGLCGFDGGALKELCDIPIHVNFKNYGIVEDAHQALMHMMAQWLYLTQVDGV